MQGTRQQSTTAPTTPPIIPYTTEAACIAETELYGRIASNGEDLGMVVTLLSLLLMEDVVERERGISGTSII